MSNISKNFEEEVHYVRNATIKDVIVEHKNRFLYSINRVSLPLKYRVAIDTTIFTALTAGALTSGYLGINNLMIKPVVSSVANSSAIMNYSENMQKDFYNKNFPTYYRWTWMSVRPVFSENMKFQKEDVSFPLKMLKKDKNLL